MWTHDSDESVKSALNTRLVELSSLIFHYLDDDELHFIFFMLSLMLYRNVKWFIHAFLFDCDFTSIILTIPFFILIVSAIWEMHRKIYFYIYSLNYLVINDDFIFIKLLEQFLINLLVCPLIIYLFRWDTYSVTF